MDHVRKRIQDNDHKFGMNQNEAIMTLIKIKGERQDRINVKRAKSNTPLLEYFMPAHKCKMLESIKNFDHKITFRWHLKIEIETNFDYFNSNRMKEELILQEELDERITSFLMENFEAIKVVGYLQKGVYHYHWYLNSDSVDLDAHEKWFEDEKIKYSREVNFDIWEDTNWQEIANLILDEENQHYGWSDYLSNK